MVGLNMKNIPVRPMKVGEEPAVCELVLSVFDKCVGPSFSPEGVSEFKRFVTVEALSDRKDKGGIVFVACSSSQGILGMIELRKPAHICMFFVNDALHRRGLGRELLARARDHCLGWGQSEMTVNSSPNALAAYERLGFSPTEPEKILNGIRFRPMRLSLKDGTFFNLK